MTNMRKLPAMLFAGMLVLGTAACVDSEDDYIDPRPQFDSQGEPNFDTDGDYIGCHGVGCDVDDPG